MQSCETCRIVNGKADGVLSKRNLIELKGGWTLSHYNEPTKRYLGYLVLATKEHRPDFTALSPNELKSLGLNLAWVTKNLKDYWLLNFPDDLLEQIYFAYFNETPYIKHLIGHELQDSLHFHIHILPRTRKMFDICGTEMLAWDLLKMVQCFPKRYLSDEQQKINLIRFLQKDRGNYDCNG